MLASGYFYKFYKYAMKEAYSDRVLEEERFQTCSRRIGFYKQIKSDQRLKNQVKQATSPFT